MMAITGRRHRIVIASLAVLLASIAACRDDSVAPRTPVPPVDQMTNLGTYMVEVNAKTGQVISYPIGSPSVPRGVDASVFGAPGSIAHAFQLQGGAPTAGNTFILRDHLENVFNFPIGTNVPHATSVFPQDTIGMYVYLTIGPIVTAGCTPNPVTCVVKADSGYDGAYTFTSVTPQPYMYFKTILEASDGHSGQGLDFTDQSPANGGPPTGINYFRVLPFRASAAVTNFKFGVSVSGARVSPNDTRWIVRYVTDSLPNRVGTALTDLRTEPDWRVRGSAGAVTDTSIQTSGCSAGIARCLQIVSTTPSLGSPADSLTYFRSDSLGTSQNAYIAATVIPSNLQNGAPSVFMGMQDRVKLISFGLSNNSVGLTDASNAFVSGSVTINPATTTSWRVAKFGSDSVVIYDGTGTKIQLYTYASLPAAPAASFPSSFFFFGNKALFNLLANPTAVTSRWSSVVYEIGATGP